MSRPLTGHSSSSNFPSEGLYFSGLVFLSGTRRDGLGEPTRSRAISRTALAAEKVFFLRFLGMRDGQLFRKETEAS